MMRARVESDPRDFALDQVRVTVVDRSASGARVWDGRAGGWFDVPDSPPATALGAVPLAFEAPEQIARLVYETLRAHFGDADVEPARALAKARDESETRRQVSEDALREIALSTVRRPS